MPVVDMDLLISISSGLGALHEDSEGRRVYVAEADCLDCLKDLQRFMRKDDPDTRDVFFQLGAWDTARTDLLPIIVHYAHDHKLVLNALKVLTFLTMPINPTSDRPGYQLMLLQKVKEAVLQMPDVLPVILGEAAEALAKHPRMNEDQSATLQVCLNLLRNLLAIADAKGLPAAAGGAGAPEAGADKPAAGTGPAADMGAGASLHVRLLDALCDCDGLQLLTAVAMHTSERPFKTEINLLIDLVHEVVRGVDPEQLIRAKDPATVTSQPPTSSTPVADPTSSRAAAPSGSKQQSSKSGAASKPQQPAKDQRAAVTMQSIVAAERQRKAQLLRQAPRLHSRDTGRFVRHHNEHNASVYVKHGARTIELPEMKVPAAIKGVRDGWEGGVEGGCDLHMPSRLAWKMCQWMDEFARSGAYNELMEVARRDAEAGLGISRLEAPDLCRFMRVARTFGCFARLKHLRDQKKLASSQAPSAADLTKQQPPAPAAPAADAPAGQEHSDASPSVPPSSFAGVSAMLGWPSFQLVLTTWLGQVDVPARSALKNWELQNCCLSLLRELVAVLEVAQASGHPHDAPAADKLQRKLLSDDLKESGLLPVLCRCAKSFKPSAQPRGHAVDIIMCLATVVRTLDRLSKADAEQGGFMVRRRKRQGGGGGGRAAKALADDDDDTAAQPDQGGPDKQTGKEGGDGQEQADGESGDKGEGGADGQEEGDKSEKGEKSGEQGGESEGDKEGGSSGGGGDGGDAAGEGGGTKAAARRDPLELLEEEEEEYEEVDEAERGRRAAEVQYDLDKRLRQELAQPAIIHFLNVQGMAFYSNNSPAVNKAVAALLWRVASPDGLNLEPMLYQLSVLRVMHKLLSDRAIRAKAVLRDYQDLLVLCTKVTQGLFKRLCPPLATAADVESKVPPLDTSPPAAAAADGASKKQAGSGSDDDDDVGLEIEGQEAEAAVEKTAEEQEAEQKAAREAREEKIKAAVERENKIRGGISSMLFLDVLFWKSASVADEISADYFLRLKDELDSGPAPLSRAPRGSKRTAGNQADEGAEGGTKAGVASWEEADGEEPAGGAAGAGGVAAAGTTAGARDLAAEHERLRKLHLAQRAAKAGPGRAVRGGLALPLEQQKQLVDEFEQLNAHKANLDLMLDRLGDAWTKDRVMRALKALGYKFGRPTDDQVTQLRSLWSQHGSTGRDLQDSLLMVAAELTGGWTTKQVKAMLTKNGILKKATRGAGRAGRVGRVGAGSDGEDSGDDSGYEAGDEPGLADDAEVVDAWGRFNGETLPDRLRLVCEQLGGGVSVKALQKKLILMGLLPKMSKVSKGKKGKDKTMVPVEELTELYEKFKDLPDTLNRIAASLSVPLTAKQVSKALVRCNLVADEAAARKAARDAADRAQLVALYQRHRTKDDYLQLMAQDMPGVTTTQQVLKLMRKHGLLEGPAEGGSRRARRAGGGGTEGGDDDGDDWVGLGGSQAVGRVPEPDLGLTLQCLANMQQAQDSRWMRPAAAVSWICGRLHAAEELWHHTGSSINTDYSLIMESDLDELFFMTDGAQELLEAAGIRNDAGDYYKIPGNADAAWRRRVQHTLNQALAMLGTDKADEELAKLKARGAQAGGAAAVSLDGLKSKAREIKASKAAAALPAASLDSLDADLGGSDLEIEAGTDQADDLFRQLGEVQQEELVVGDVDLDLLGLDEQQQEEQEVQRAPRVLGRPATVPASGRLNTLASQMVSVDSSSDDDSGSGSDDSSSSGSGSQGDSSGSQGDSSGASDAEVPVKAASRPAAKPPQTAGRSRSKLPSFAAASSDEDGPAGGGRGAGRKQQQQRSKPAKAAANKPGARKGGVSSKSSPVKKKIKSAAGTTDTASPGAAAAAAQAGRSSRGDAQEDALPAPVSRRNADGSALQRQEQRKAKQADAGVSMAARKAALQALAAKHQGLVTASQGITSPDATAGHSGRSTQEPATALRENVQAGEGARGDGAGHKKRRLLKAKDQENAAPAQTAAGGGDPAPMDDLEDF